MEKYFMFTKKGSLSVFLGVVLLATYCRGHAQSCWNTRQDQIDRRDILGEVQCMRPRNRTVQIPIPIGYDYVYPSAVVVPRCTHHQCKMLDEACVATETRIRRVKIQAFKINSDLDSMCKYEDIEEHLGCGCRCEVSQKDCSVNEVFERKMCRCKCQPKLEEECMLMIEERPGMYMWDPKTCTCPCNNMRQVCGDGEFWADKLCKCLDLTSNAIIN